MIPCLVFAFDLLVLGASGRLTGLLGLGFEVSVLGLGSGRLTGLVGSCFEVSVLGLGSGCLTGLVGFSFETSVIGFGSRGSLLGFVG